VSALRPSSAPLTATRIGAAALASRSCHRH